MLLSVTIFSSYIVFQNTDLGFCFFKTLGEQEELAFVFEMLQQFEDALVQYDELDALFSQYVVNFGAGGEW